MNDAYSSRGVKTSFSRDKEANDAEFTNVRSVDVKEKEEEYSHKALAKPIKIMRHPLMHGKSEDYVEELSEEIDLNKELGLENQAKIKQCELIRKDVDVLTKSNNYFEVTEKGLEKLFGIRKLKSKCIFHNLKIAFITSGMYIPILCFTFGILSTVSSVIVKPVLFTVFLMIAATSFFVVTVLRTLSIIKSSRKRFPFIRIRLKTEAIEDTKIQILKGAALKFKEAKDTDIFSKFTISYPEVYCKGIDTVKQPNMDPAILAQTVDGRMFMVVWWDIEKDVEKSITKIKDLKQFKLN